MTSIKNTMLTDEQLETLQNLEWPEQPVLLGSSAGIDGSIWKLEVVGKSGFAQIKRYVERLSAKSKAANPFFEPAFLEPAAEHLGKGNVEFLCLSEITGEHRELKFFTPASLSGTRMRRHKVLRIWSHPYAPVSTPLIDTEDHARTVTELVNCLETASDRYCSAILFETLPKHSGFAKVIHIEPRLSNRLLRFSPVTRGGIIGSDGINAAVCEVTGKRKQRLRKARERLEAFGELTFHEARDKQTVADALKEHLLLEDKGWKSKRGTSILKDDKAAAFTKEAIGQMTNKDQCSIHSLNLNDSMIASMILIRKNGYYFPWKIAFDEAYAKYSAGNLLLSHVNEEISKDREFVLLDSLASELNETAKRFWPDPLELSSMVIGLGPSATKITLQISSEMEFLAKAKLAIKKRLGRSL